MKKIYLIISIIILGWFAFSIGGECDKNAFEIISVSALPQKVKVGDILTITAEIKDASGIEKVSAIMPFENGADEIQLSLISGNNKSGKWQAEWKCHNTINIEYITAITAVNVLGKSATAEVSWWDDTETVWLSGWNYRKKITFNNPTPSANYQVKVDLSTAIMGDPYSNVQTDGDDIRFVQADGTNLDYWIETWSATGDSTLWVEVATISTSTIYMYYGNPSASSASNGANTFEFFDDFEGTSLDTDKWTEQSNAGSHSVAGSILTISDSAANNNYHAISTVGYFTATKPVALRSKWKTSVAAAGMEVLGGFSDDTDYQLVDGGNAVLLRTYRNTDRGYFYTVKDGTCTTDYEDSFGITSYHIYDVIWDDTSKVFKDGVEKFSSATNIPTASLSVRLIDQAWTSASNPSSGYWDWILVRKYAATEPAATVAADEEKRSGAPGVNPSGGGGMVF